MARTYVVLIILSAGVLTFYGIIYTKDLDLSYFNLHSHTYAVYRNKHKPLQLHKPPTNTESNSLAAKGNVLQNISNIEYARTKKQNNSKFTTSTSNKLDTGLTSPITTSTSNNSHNKDTSHVNTTSSVILYAKFRTGSTFASHFLERHSRYFFTYEPLHLIELAKNKNNASLLKYNATDVLREILSCNFR